VGGVRAFYAWAKWPKETSLGHRRSKEGNSIRVIGNVTFCWERPGSFCQFLFIPHPGLIRPTSYDRYSVVFRDSGKARFDVIQPSAFREPCNEPQHFLVVDWTAFVFCGWPAPVSSTKLGAHISILRCGFRRISREYIFFPAIVTACRLSCVG
jgi:hypothetical protein